MAWSESGIYTATLRDCLSNIIAGDFRLVTSKLALHNNTDTPNFALDPATWTNANEVTDASNWTTGGRLVSAAASGGGSIAPSLALSGDGKSLVFDATDVSVATTTITAARGLKWHMDALSPKALICGINFGADYTTSAGTFAITWSNSPVGIWVIKCVPSGA